MNSKIIRMLFVGIIAAAFTACGLQSHNAEIALLEGNSAGPTLLKDQDGWYTYGSYKYKGELRNARPHGQGEIRWSDGRTYKGAFSAGLMSGQGVLKTVDGKVYEGEFENDSFHGQGLLSFADGSFYEGEFTGGRPSGNIVVKSADQALFKGHIQYKYDYNGREKYLAEGVVSHPEVAVSCQGRWYIEAASALQLFDSVIRSASKTGCRNSPRTYFAFGPYRNQEGKHLFQKSFVDQIRPVSGQTYTQKIDRLAERSGPMKDFRPHGHHYVRELKSNKQLRREYWFDGELIMTAPSDDGWKKQKAENSCAVADNTEQWVYLSGPCKNGLLDGAGVAANIHNPFIQLAGNFKQGKLVRGQLQQPWRNPETGDVEVLVVKPAAYRLAKSGRYQPTGKTHVAADGEVFFAGEFQANKDDKVGFSARGTCRVSGGAEPCEIGAFGIRIDAIAKARWEAIRIRNNQMYREQQRRQAVNSCNSALKYMDYYLNKAIAYYDKFECREKMDHTIAGVKDRIQGANYYSAASDITRDARKCLAREKTQMEKQISWFEDSKRDVKQRCRGIKENILPKFEGFSASIRDRFNDRQATLYSSLNALERQYDHARVDYKKYREAQRRQWQQEMLASIRRHGDYGAFLDSIGADRSSSGAWAQTTAVVKNHEKIYDLKRQYQQAYTHALSQSTQLKDYQKSAPSNSLDSSDIVEQAASLCRRSGGSWNGSQRRCTTKGEAKMVTYNIRLLGAACYGDGPFCRSENGADVSKGQAAAGAGDTAGSLGTFDDPEFRVGGGGAGDAGSTTTSPGFQQTGSSAGGSPASDGKSALVVTWQVANGKWKAFGPTQGSLGILEASEKEAMDYAMKSPDDAQFIQSVGKFKVYRINRPLRGGDLDVYSYAQSSYGLDLEPFK